jgi:hypothetical protein
LRISGAEGYPGVDAGTSKSIPSFGALRAGPVRHIAQVITPKTKRIS